MSSQHRNLAAIWDHLLGRHDASVILREIIGHHALQSVALHDEPQSSRETYQAFVWIKTIYDLQRCYLSGITSTSSQSLSDIFAYLIPVETVFPSLIYLIHVKNKSFPGQIELLANELARYRYLLTLTILSGLRLLLLYKDSISQHQRYQLQAALNTTWQDTHLQGVERCLVQQVFAAMLCVLDNPTHADAYQAERKNGRLPTYNSGLYPLDIRPEISITPLIHAMAEEDDDDWIDAYSAIYDILWAVECAVTKRYIDLRHDHRGSFDRDPSIIENDEIFEQLLHQRSSLIVSIFHLKGPMRPSSLLMESLAITLVDWDEALDSFLSRQDSLMQHRMSLPQEPTRLPNYRKQIEDLQPYFTASWVGFIEWFSQRESCYSPYRDTNITHSLVQESVRNWAERMASPNTEMSLKRFEEYTNVYIVNCPKLHAVPKKYLSNQLRWSDRFAYESCLEDSPIIKWKEGIRCPSCSSEEKIKTARLVEPLTQSSKRASQDLYSQSQFSGDSLSSAIETTASTASRSVSDGGSMGVGMPGLCSMSATIPTTVSQPRSDPGATKSVECRPPQYDSPISPLTYDLVPRRTYSHGSSSLDCPVSPLNESLNIPIPMTVGSRLSVDLPIPVNTPSRSGSTTGRSQPSVSSDISSFRQNTLASASQLSWSDTSLPKSKQSSRSTRFANSIRRKSIKEQHPRSTLPKDPQITFAASGSSLLVWDKVGDSVARFDVSNGNTSILQGCVYEVKNIQAVAAGTRKCAIISSKGAHTTVLTIFDGLSLSSESRIESHVSGRPHDVCIAVSKDDKHVAISTHGRLDLYKLEDGIKQLSFQHQMDVFELRGGASHKRSIPVLRTTSTDYVTDVSKADPNSWFSTHTRGLSVREAAEEQLHQSAIVSRKLNFSTDSQRLVVATQLGDHCVHVDVWDITREPVSSLSENSRSFKLPPWVLNDGDLTDVFYDSARRAALVTACIGKEYPVLIPFPGFGELQNETFSTKIVCAAQSPSGSTFVVANAMTEIIQFEYTAAGTLSPRKLKKASKHIGNSVFKPGAIALAMPAEDVLQVFWIKDGKCMLRSIRLGSAEAFKDVDIRAQYDRLTSLKDRRIIARAPSVHIPELDAGDYM